MCHTESAGEEDNERKIKPYAMTKTVNFSLAKEHHRILQDPSIIKGVHAKCQANKKISK
jgi:hypothetical protein